jgi:endonuclease/exonuclease/phosphatase family metal-dependent hydrolase
VKLVSYNTQYSKGKDGRYDLERIAKTLEGADVIALQEVDRFWPRTGMIDQPAELAALLPNSMVLPSTWTPAKPEPTAPSSTAAVSSAI